TAGNTRAIVAPRSETERLVIEAWAKALNNTDISVDDDFFITLGGHSLVAAQAVTALRTTLGNERISVRDLYAARTAEKLAQRIDAMQPEPRPTTPASAEEKISRSEAVRKTVPAWERATCYTLQAVSLAVYYAAIGLPVAVLVFTIMSVLREGIALQMAVRTLTI